MKDNNGATHYHVVVPTCKCKYALAYTLSCRSCLCSISWTHGGALNLNLSLTKAHAPRVSSYTCTSKFMCVLCFHVCMNRCRPGAPSAYSYLSLTCMYECMYVYMCVHVCIYRCMYVCMCTSIYTCVHACVCIYVYVGLLTVDMDKAFVCKFMNSIIDVCVCGCLHGFMYECSCIRVCLFACAREVGYDCVCACGLVSLCVYVYAMWICSHLVDRSLSPPYWFVGVGFPRLAV